MNRGVLCEYTGSGRRKACLLEGGREGNNLGVIIYSFNVNISPMTSCGVLECDIVILENYTLLIL